MKLIDTDETIVLVTGTSITAEERDRPTAYGLKAEIDRRGGGLAYRRAVVVGDTWYLEHRIFHLNPTIAIGGPGANGVTADFTDELPTVLNLDERAFVQADFEGEVKRASLWGVDASSTLAAVEAFVQRGVLDDLLQKIWRFRTETLV
ncbi:MAG TPA: hypothetical protein VFW66_15045 [Gemmatimonadales bacterium]|nr:hypothetical protein [Gemmatimonadales bacterium]